MSDTIIRYAGGMLICDVVNDASVEHDLELTEHPIDDGSVITDHAIRKPVVINLTLSQTQTPLRPVDGFSPTQKTLEVKSVTYGRQKTKLDIPQPRIAPSVTGLIRAGTAALKGAGTASIEGLKVGAPQAQTLGITVLQAGAPVDRVGAFYEQLLKLMLAVEPVTLTFKRRDYAGFYFSKVHKADKPGQVGKSTFDVSLKLIPTVATKQVALPAVPKAKAKKDRGVQYGPPPPPVTEADRRKTIAAQMEDLARGAP